MHDDSGAEAAPCGTSTGSTSEYVRKHNIAPLVDVLVQQVLEERPTDPYAFLADRVRLEATLRAKGRSVAPSL